jgi:hypothetical protein
MVSHHPTTIIKAIRKIATARRQGRIKPRTAKATITNIIPAAGLIAVGRLE